MATHRVRATLKVKIRGVVTFLCRYACEQATAQNANVFLPNRLLTLRTATMMMPTVTTIISTFFQYYQAGADSYANHGTLLGNFAPVGTGANTPTPFDLKAIAESTTHPLVFLACDSHRKVLVRSWYTFGERRTVS